MASTQEIASAKGRDAGGANSRSGRWISVSFSTLCLALLVYWLLAPLGPPLLTRAPIPENRPRPASIERAESSNPGTLILGAAKHSSLPGSWPQFRGPNRNGQVEGFSLDDAWLESEPKVHWKIEVGEGHAGAAVQDGRVYLVDYDEKMKEDVIRCLSLDDGEEIWRYTYSVKVKRNHGMSRTIPAVEGDFLVALGPKCHLHCFHSKTGALRWKKDLVNEYKTRIPEWYAGQCPLIQEDRVILAPGGRCLMTALTLSQGEPVWETPNDAGWEMTHSSILPIRFEDRPQYVYCSSGGVIGVDATGGDLLWTLPEWKTKIAMIPSPLDLGNGKIFLTGGYNMGAMMIQVHQKGDRFEPEILFKNEATVFGSDQQTPIFHGGLIYGVIPGGKVACLSQEGEQLWMDETNNFGLGPYAMVGDKLLVLDDNGKKPGELCLFEVDRSGPTRISGHRVLDGHDAWAPMAFAGNRIILRDSKTIVCLELRGS